MTRVDEINAQIAKLEAQRKDVMQEERATVLAKMKADIKLYGFKTTDFKTVLATRKKRGTGTAAKKTATKKKLYDFMMVHREACQRMGLHPGSRCLPRHPVRGALGNHRRCGGFGQPAPVRVDR